MENISTSTLQYCRHKLWYGKFKTYLMPEICLIRKERDDRGWMRDVRIYQCRKCKTIRQHYNLSSDY